ELHISYSGARWFHKHWSFPTGVFLNGIAWDPSGAPFLTNATPTLFLEQPVHFENAALLSSTGRDFVALRASPDGIILNFADNPMGADHYEATVALPAGPQPPEASLAVVSGASILPVAASGVAVQTVRGVWYELERTSSLTPPDWRGTGSF